MVSKEEYKSNKDRIVLIDQNLASLRKQTRDLMLEKDQKIRESKEFEQSLINAAIGN